MAVGPPSISSLPGRTDEHVIATIASTKGLLNELRKQVILRFLWQKRCEGHILPNPWLQAAPEEVACVSSPSERARIEGGMTWRGLLNHTSGRQLILPRNDGS
jgi:hypothetical protein